MTIDELTSMRLGITREDLDTLSSNALLGQLTPRELGSFIEILAHLHATPGTVFMQEGEEGDFMYFVLEGVAVLSRNAHVIRRVQRGEHFGELSMLGVRLRSSTVVAETDMRLARLNRSRFTGLAARSPAAALHLLQALVGSLGDDLTQLTDSVAALVGRRSKARPLQIRIRTASGEQHVTAGAPIQSLLPDFVGDQPVVAALLDSKPVMLDTPVVSDAHVEAVHLADIIGRDAFRRSVGLLLLEAARTVAPQLSLRLGHAVDNLRVVELSNHASLDRSELCRMLTAELQRMVAQDVEFRTDVWTVEEARMQLIRQGWLDAAQLLHTSRAPVTTLQACGQLHALVVGPVVPSARVLQGVRLLPHGDNLLLDYGPLVRPHTSDDAHALAVERELAHPRFGAEMVHAHREWLASMGVRSVGDFNDMCVRGEVARVIRVAEGFAEKRIGQIADLVAARRGQLRVIAIAGPSSSGKTTFIKRLSVQLEVAGIHPVGLSLDDYYVDRARSPRDASGDYDFEALEALELELLRDNLIRLVAGETCQTPRFDFKRGKSLRDGGPRLQLQPDQILLIEGIHALNDALWPAAISPDARMRIFIHPATTLPLDRLTGMSSADLRLLRRIVRDRHGRATSAAQTIARWPSVRRGERRHIYPTYGNADAVFDTALAYELGVLKVYAEHYLLEVQEGDPAYPIAYRLRQLIDPIVAIHPDHVPSTSILREFIGGSGFEA